jgi:hypothetical protein
MQDLLLVQILQRQSNLFGYLEDLVVIQSILLLVEQVKEGTLVNELSDHVVEAGAVQCHAHVQDNVGMSQLVDHLDLFNEVLHSLLSDVSLPELLYCYLSAEPLSLVNIPIAPSANEIILAVEEELFKGNEEVEPTGFEALNLPNLAQC